MYFKRCTHQAIAVGELCASGCFYTNVNNDPKSTRTDSAHNRTCVGRTTQAPATAAAAATAATAELLCTELVLRAAELRELLRLESGAVAGPIGAAQLRADLRDAGIAGV